MDVECPLLRRPASLLKLTNDLLMLRNPARLADGGPETQRLRLSKPPDRPDVE
jgi:hypothetical protein